MEVTEYQCNTCRKSYNCKKSFQRHMKLGHQEKKENYECTICSKVFRQKGHLTEHIDSFHKENINVVIVIKNSNMDII